MTKCQIMNMHKHFVRYGLPIVTLVGLLGLTFATSKSGAVDAPDLISAVQLDIQKSADVLSLPSSLNGNIDCIQDGPYSCVVDTSYGKFSSSGFVKPNRTANYYELISYVDNRAHSIAIPNSNTIINYTTEPPYGFYLYFTKNFASSITQTTIHGTNIKQYQINRLYDGRLIDKTNHRLAADYASMSFSANGQWMVVSMPNVAMLRVNLDTFEVVPFAIGFNYTIGLDPAVKTAVSNDGRYATVASKTFGRFEAYDLNTCATGSDTINGPVVCQSKNLQTLMQQKVPGYISVGQVRFINDSALRLYANYNVGTGNKIASFIINPTGTGVHQHDYLALGDSYISGEGAYNYLQGTDTPNNSCHVSILSYPYLLARDLSYNSFHSVACSGATIEDITNSAGSYRGQANPKTEKQKRPKDEIQSVKNNFSAGYIDQLDFVTTYQPQVITLSVGGNDVGFKDVLENCVAFWNIGTCYANYEDRLELVRQVNARFANLVSTYQTLKNNSPPDTRIYIIGYPQIVKPGGNCGFNVQLNADEVVFAQQFTDYLDGVIQQAAAKAGVFYVDTQNAFNGHRLCEAKPGEFAVNGLTKGSDYPQFLGGPLGNESYHPTPLGYSLLRDIISATTNGLSAVMPVPNTTAAVPAEAGLDILSIAHSGRAVSATGFDDSLSDDILLRGSVSDIFVSGLENSLKPLASYRVELHSTPVVLGNFTSSSAGDLSFQATIPSTVMDGFHGLHIYGTNVAGEPIDIYKTIYVAASGDDYNGNGITNDSDPCVFVDASGQDFDQDGVDDACDGIISEAPPAPVANAPSTQPPSDTSSGTAPEQNNSSSNITTSPSDALSPVFTTLSFSPVVVSQSSSAPQTSNTSFAKESQSVSQGTGKVLANTKTKEPGGLPKKSPAAAVLIGGIIILLGTLSLWLGLREK